MFWFKKRGEDAVSDKIKTLDINVKDSFDNLKKDMQKVSDWITNFNSKESTQEKRLNLLEERIEHLNMMVEHTFNNSVVERSNSRNEEEIAENERVFTRVQSFNRSVQPFMNVHEHTDLEVLTPAQKQVIALLTYSGGPMGYDEISKGLGINEVTARRHINDIRRAGFSIKRKVSVNNRRNMFYLDKEVRDKMGSNETVKVSKSKPK